jgi:hypothetical protein
MTDKSEMHTKMKKRNRVVGLSLLVFVILLGVVSYYRMQGLNP